MGKEFSISVQYIDLPSLRLIQRGGVRVDQNANLCYVRTVNWAQILGNQTQSAAPIHLLSNRLICPDSCQAQCGGGSSGNPLVGAASSHSLIKLNGNSSQDVTSKGDINEKMREKQAPGFCWSSVHCQTSMAFFTVNYRFK